MRGILLVIGLCAAPCAAATLFVDDSATPGGNGLTWGAAFVDLQDALDAARLDPNVTEIHVAAGVYKADRGTFDLTMSFELVDGVAVLGGFPNGGGTPAQRNPALHETLLLGDLLGDDQPPNEFGFLSGINDNTRHVVVAIDCSPATALDGFVIRGGHANGSIEYEMTGGNVFISGGAPTIRNCTLERARAGWSGGGLAAVESAASIENCVFRENVGDMSGGGAAMIGTTGASVAGCRFERNIGGSGCGLYCGSFSTIGSAGNTTSVHDCEFVENNGVIGATAGGGVFVHAGDNVITDCRFYDNRANGGGGVYVSAGEARIERCIFFGNEGEGDGGGAIAAVDFASATPVHTTDVVSCLMAGNNGAAVAVASFVNFTNCTIAHNIFPDSPIFLSWPAVFSQNAPVVLNNSIVWGNSDFGTFGNERDFLYGGTLYTVADSIVEDWSGVLAGNAWDTDPGFADTSGLDGDPYVAADNNYRLRIDSFAVDMGSNGFVPAMSDFDAEGRDRILDGNGDSAAIVDIGALERCFADLDNDGSADAGDTAAFVSALEGPNTASPGADLDSDGDTDLADFAILQRLLADGCGPVLMP